MFQQQATNQPSNSVYEERSENLERRVNFEKVIGYILLFIGLFTIFLTVFLTYNVFVGRTAAPKVANYQIPPIDIAAPNASVQLPSSIEIPEGFGTPSASSSALPKLKIPDEIVNDTIDKGLFYILMMFVASAGSKVSGIGVRLIKDIKVKV